MSEIDVLVVGGGPSGLMAAIGAAERGEWVMVCDEWPEIGGRLRYEQELARIDGKAVAPAELQRSLIAEARKRQVDLRPDTTVWGLFRTTEGLEAGVVSGGQEDIVRPKRLVLATGTTDRAVIFPGATLPGVMTLRALRILLHVHGVRPGRRFVIVGEDAESLSQELTAAGGVVVLHVPSADAARLRATGDGGVQRVSVDEREAEADIVVIAAGTRPDAQLAWSLECEPEVGLPLVDRRPKRDGFGQTSVAGVYVCGSVSGAIAIDEAMRDGYRVGAQSDTDAFDRSPMANLGEAGA